MEITKTKPGRKDGGYTRLLGDIELGALISRLHSACISSGNELEKLILEKSNLFLVRTVEEMESLLSNGDKFNKKTYLIPKKIVKKSAKFKSEHEPDFLILKKDSKTLYITELKDGDAFDTKKSAGEVESLRKFQNQISRKISYKTMVIVCSFNQTSKEKIIQGFKNKITSSEAFTGQEFCELIGIDYQAIIQERIKDQKENFKFFCNELLKITEFKRIILEILQKK